MKTCKENLICERLSLFYRAVHEDDGVYQTGTTSLYQLLDKHFSSLYYTRLKSQQMYVG